MTPLAKSIATTAALALTLSATAVTFTGLAATAAYADRGNGNGNGNGNRNRGERGNSGKDRAERGNRGNGNGNGRGAIARELRGLNSANANQNARMNASPNSMQGKLYAYQQTREGFIETVAVQDEAYAEYQRLIGLTEDQILEQYPEGGYEEAVTAAANKYQAARDAAVLAQTETEASLLVLTDGRELSDAAVSELHRRLGF